MPVAPPGPLTARRIVVYGMSGSGKSTTAARIAGRTGLPWWSVDDHTWEPGWVEVPPEVQRERIARITAGPDWVLDSAYSQWLDVVLDRVELIVGLDFALPVSYGRLLRRCVTRLARRTEICNGNRETWVNTFWRRDSILRWAAGSHPRKRARLDAWSAAPDGPAVLRFTRPRDLDAWLRTLTPPI